VTLCNKKKILINSTRDQGKSELTRKIQWILQLAGLAGALAGEAARGVVTVLARGKDVVVAVVVAVSVDGRNDLLASINDTSKQKSDSTKRRYNYAWI
jgi:hypothetical protein